MLRRLSSRLQIHLREDGGHLVGTLFRALVDVAGELLPVHTDFGAQREGGVLVEEFLRPLPRCDELRFSRPLRATAAGAEGTVETDLRLDLGRSRGRGAALRSTRARRIEPLDQGDALVDELGLIDVIGQPEQPALEDAAGGAPAFVELGQLGVDLCDAVLHLADRLVSREAGADLLGEADVGDPGGL